MVPGKTCSCSLLNLSLELLLTSARALVGMVVRWPIFHWLLVYDAAVMWLRVWMCVYRSSSV